MHLLSGKRFVLIGFIVVLLTAIPFTVYLAQKQQETKSKAEVLAVLSLLEGGGQSSQGSPITRDTGQSLDLDLWVDPGNQTGYDIRNSVVYVGVTIKYDSTKLALNPSQPAIPCGGVEKVHDLFQPISPPNCSNPGTVTAAWIITDPNNALEAKAIIAKFHFLPIAPTSSPIEISFDTNNTTVASKVKNTSPENNSLLSANSAWVTISGEALTPAPTAGEGTPTATPVPGQATNTPAPTAGTGNPVCTALNTDRTPNGNAPFTVSLTANGNDPNGTISKVTFDFGDGPVQNVTQSGGVGTNSVSVQVSHTYQNAGSYKATATLTDNNNLLSDPTTCTQTITVSQATPTQAGGGGGGAIYVTATPTVTPSGGAATPTEVTATTEETAATAVPTLKPGPNNNIAGIGIAGIITAIIGSLIFLAL
ncbi:MAG: PKD domain-containing protein [Candidatus Levyibacteriota bacterium]